MLSPVVKIHLFRTFTCPRLRSSLSSFASCHRKCLKGFLHLSMTAPTPAIHFLLGDLPQEGRIHRDMFALFFGVWSNPDTKIYQIVKYILSNSPENSTTWAINFRHICKMYNLEDTLSYLMSDPPSKSQFKENVNTRFTAFHEKDLRSQAIRNSNFR